MDELRTPPRCSLKRSGGRVSAFQGLDTTKIPGSGRAKTKGDHHDTERARAEGLGRIMSTVGTITDTAALYIGPEGDINGIIVGTEGKAKIQTIGAGGYNIQCFHFRTLIHEIK